MVQVGVKCIDCHMPRIVKSAAVRGKYEADIRTHISKINPGKNANMFYEEKNGNKIKLFAKTLLRLIIPVSPVTKTKTLNGLFLWQKVFTPMENKCTTY